MPDRTPVLSLVRRWALLLATALLLAVAGCAAPSTNHGGPPEGAAKSATGQAPPASTAGESPVGNPPRPPQLPPVKRPAPRPSLGPGLGDGPAAGDPAAVDRSCSSDADCTVKDVGNCCGYYPACVNVDSPTDPEGVKAQCSKSGMASVCGFPAITGCQCVAGQCEGRSQALLE
jgi:hypothetical protein